MTFKRFLPVLGAVFFLSTGLFHEGCSKNYAVAPLAASGGGSTSTNPNGPIIEAFYVQESTPYVSTPAISVIVENGGTAITSASVTLITSLGPMPIPFIANSSSNPPANSGITNIYGGEYYAAGSSYTAGQNCTFIVAFNGSTYTCNFTAFNPSGNVTKGSSGVTCTWTGGGNLDFVQVAGNDSFQDGPNPALSSPFILPASSFPNDPAGAGNDYIFLWLVQDSFSAFSGCQASSVVVSGKAQEVYY